MKLFATLWAILWRATLFFPLAVILFTLACTALILPPSYCLVMIFFVPSNLWAWGGLALWTILVFGFKRKISTYFKTETDTLL